jgi:hypothetical protein
MSIASVPAQTTCKSKHLGQLPDVRHSAFIASGRSFSIKESFTDCRDLPKR